MDHYAVSNSHSTKTEEQEEFLYSSAPQNLDDVICEGSDTEQTAEEIRAKQRRYENIARRYLCGHRPLIQSASLRGPLSRESGWVNPWHKRPRKEEDWWQPRSEDMLFTRDNVMKRAADHGLGYLNPTEALAWCKATAEAEARKELDRFDSMKAVYSGESDSEYRGEETPTDGFPHAQLAPKTRDDKNQVSPDRATRPPGRHSFMAEARHSGIKDNVEFTKNGKGAKRPAGSQWLKGCYVSKKARWEGSPASSPTPILNQQSERDRYHRQSSERSTGSENGLPDPKSQSMTPWSQDAQQRSMVSIFGGRTVQDPQSKDSRRGIWQQGEDLDDLDENSRETMFVSAPNFLSGSQGKRERNSMDHSLLNLSPDDWTMISAKDTSFNTPTSNSVTYVSRKPDSTSNKLPKLPRSLENRVDMELVEDDSFVTEVAPSSRNLEEFQYKKKRRRLKKVKSRESDEASHDQLEDVPKSFSRSAVANGSEECASLRASPKVDSAQESPIDRSNDESNGDFEKSLGNVKRRMAASSPDAKSQMEPSPGGRKSNGSYFKKVAVMSVNLLPSLQIDSSFSPFSSFSAFGTSKPAPTPEFTRRSALEVVAGDQMIEDYGQCPALKQSEVIQPDDAQTPPVVSPEDHSPVTTSFMLNIEMHPESVSQRSTSWGRYTRSMSPKHHRPVVDAPTLDLDILPMRSSVPPSCNERSKVFSSRSLINSPGQSIAILNPKDHVARFSQETNIDDDSTQLFNSTAQEPSKKPRSSPAIAHASLTAKEKVVEAQRSELSHGPGDHDKALGEITNKETLDSIDGELSAVESLPEEDTGSNNGEVQDEMEIIQNALSQSCRGISSRGSSQSDNCQSSHPPISAAPTKPGGTTPLWPNMEDEALTPNVDQEIWEGCGPQSPWVTENILLAVTPHLNQHNAAFATAKQETSVAIGSLPAHDAAEETSDWQAIERPVTPDNNGIKPFKDFMTPKLSPERPEAPSNYDEVSNTQLLIEAATNNPWTSNSKQRASRKPKKRVSFGVLSEERPDSQPQRSTFSKQGPASPPPPQILDRSREDDIFDDGTTVMNKFGMHFSAAAGFKHLLPGKNSSLLSSPAVGAMAEAFIAADRETSIEKYRQAAQGESPTRHLKPKSDARTNLSPSDTTDYDSEVNFDEFLGEAGNFLEDWSVDSEVKKVKDSRGKGNGRGDTNSRRNLFGMTSVWS